MITYLLNNSGSPININFFSEVLSDNNVQLLKIIKEHHLADLSNPLLGNNICVHFTFVVRFWSSLVKKDK